MILVVNKPSKCLYTFEDETEEEYENCFDAGNVHFKIELKSLAIDFNLLQALMLHADFAYSFQYQIGRIIGGGYHRQPISTEQDCIDFFVRYIADFKKDVTVMKNDSVVTANTVLAIHVKDKSMQEKVIKLQKARLINFAL